MSEFVVNDDMFGRYCRIKTDFSEDMHMYKIVSLLESNNYCNVPLRWNSGPTLHKEVVPVLLVIHCGIDETKVHRVALSDCEIQPIANNTKTKHGKWVSVSFKSGANAGMKCNICGARIKYSEYFNGNHNFCHKCGADMREERKDEE